MCVFKSNFKRLFSELLNFNYYLRIIVHDNRFSRYGGYDDFKNV